MATVIGVFSGILTILGFLESKFPARNANAATVRIAAGLSGGTGAAQPAGDVVSVRVFNENQGSIGTNNGYQWIPDGGFKDIRVSQPNNQQATYLQVHAGNDGTCIPYITVTWADGSKYGWSGDWGKYCGLPWHYGNVYVDNSGNKPTCTWIDKDQTAAGSPEVIFIHFPSFTSKSTSRCGYPALRAYHGGSAIISKRSEAAADSRLIISSDPQHDPVELCTSETSHGPHLANTALGLYCNMETREILPFCGEDEQGECFDVAAARNQTLSARDLDGGSEGSFTRLIDWED